MTEETEALMPRRGCYFVFSIDSVATVESLEDCEATRAAKKMCSKKYLAYASEGVSVFDLDARYHSYSIRLAKQGMPSRMLDDFVEPDMCVPISPATEHPLDRQPMGPSKPLPWPDCYHPSLHCETTVRVRQRFEDYSAAAELPVSEMSRHARIMREDDFRRGDLIQTSNPSPPSPEDDNSITNSIHSRQDSIIDPSVKVNLGEPSPIYESTSPHAGSSCHSLVNDDENDSLDDIRDFFAAIIEMTRPPDTMVVIEMSYDLSSVKNPADPKEFFQEIAHLEQLEKESKARANQRARMIDEAAFSKSKSSNRSHRLKTLFRSPRSVLVCARQRFTNLLESCCKAPARCLARRLGSAIRWLSA